MAAVTAENTPRSAETGTPHRPKVTVTIETDGYRSAVDFPLGTDAGEAFPSWLTMQMDYLARWKPGTSTSVSERQPTAMKVAVCEYLLEVNRGFVAESGSPLIPPTAINWLGDGIISAILAVPQSDGYRSPSDGDNGA